MVEVSDRLAAAVLDTASSKLELRVPLAWEERAISLRAQGLIHNSHGLPVRLGLQISKDKPWKVTVYLLIYGVTLRRLDVNGSHRNRTDGHRWTFQTHKHTYSDAHADAVAYTPTDIPSVSFENVGADDYRAVLEAFCEECGIALGSGYHWNPPETMRQYGSTVGPGGAP